MGTGQKSSAAYEMTPEQKAKLNNFGRKNGVPEQKVQAHLNPPNQVAQQPIKPQITGADKAPAIKTVQAQTLPEMAANVDELEQDQEFQTYFSYKDEQAGSLEIDLIAFREKGYETRYLSLTVSGLDVRQNPPVEQSAYLSIGSKEEFESLKAFFTQLNWED